MDINILRAEYIFKATAPCFWRHTTLYKGLRQPQLIKC